MAAEVTKIGRRLRRLRLERGLSQSALAARLGISASYLNLIEHDRRNLTVPLLLEASRILEVDPQAFSPGHDIALAGEIAGILKDPLFENLSLSSNDAREMALEAPELCRALITSHRSYRRLRNDLQNFSERLASNAFLSGSAYRLRDLLTSITSFAEILHDNSDLPAAERQKFLGILLGEARNLTETVSDILEFVGDDDITQFAGDASPRAMAADFLQSRNYYIQELEDSAMELRREAGLDGPFPHARLIGFMLERLGITVEIRDIGGEDSPPVDYHGGSRRLVLSRALPRSEINMQLVILLARLTREGLFAELTGTISESVSPAARTAAEAALWRYFANACLLPYEEFLDSARQHAYDIEALACNFGASFEQVCHRLVSLRCPGSEGIPFHLIQVDPAGNIQNRFSATGFRIPRHGNACPRWAVYRAFTTPGIIQTQISELPDKSRFFVIARTVEGPHSTFGRPKSLSACAIGCHIRDAGALIYARGQNLEEPSRIMPIGHACRLCERENCTDRSAPRQTVMT